jgi:hypothetical protein
MAHETIGLALDLPGFSVGLLGRAARDVALCAEK